MRWALTLLTALFLLGWALAPWPELGVGQGRSVQMADGYLTIRLWSGAERAPAGVPPDMVAEGSIPDTHDVSLWIVLAALVMARVVLSAWDRRAAAQIAKHSANNVPEIFA